MKFGIKEAYPNVPLPVKLKGVVQLIRPLTIVPPLIAGCIGASLPIIGSIREHLVEVMLVGLMLSLAQATGQAFNQVFGWREDAINKPYRPIPSGRLTIQEATLVASFVALLTCVVAYPIGMILQALIFLAMGFAYNTFIKYSNEWLSLVWLAIARGFLPFIISYSMFGNLYSPKPWVISLFLTLWVLAFQSTKDIPDIEGDKVFNIRTLPTVYGIETTTRIITGLSVLPFMELVLSVYLGLIGTEYLVLGFLWGLAFINIKMLTSKSEHFENTKAWIGFYAGIGITYLLCLVIEVVL